ncbi:MAG: protoheme IX farnesyltransferase [Candidatus Lindowbacteria bacterium]|nr:protoheme IX farnesyltransferase [Candidatus Lindowbacteria bacterium]
MNETMNQTMNENVSQKSSPAVFLRDCLIITKPFLSFAVLFTVAGGFVLGSIGKIDFVLLLHTLFGSGIAAVGSSALNMWIERDEDAKMKRTGNRPIPSGRMSAQGVAYFGWVASFVGFLYLGVLVNWVAAGVTFGCWFVYLAVYTPAKRTSGHSTVLGAISGALPPLIGWVAARGQFTLMGLYLFGILFFWQLPHFLAIGWIYKDQYKEAGMKILPVIDPTGRSTATQVLINSLLLFWLGLYPYAFGFCGELYFVVVFTAGALFMVAALAFAKKRTLGTARFLYKTSIVYIMLLFGTMMYERTMMQLG